MNVQLFTCYAFDDRTLIRMVKHRTKIDLITRSILNEHRNREETILRDRSDLNFVRNVNVEELSRLRPAFEQLSRGNAAFLFVASGKIEGRVERAERSVAKLKEGATGGGIEPQKSAVEAVDGRRDVQARSR